MKITVIGTGYVGLVVGTCLAEMGNQVLCLDLDRDRERVRLFESGVVPIHEPGLAEMIHRNVSAGRVAFTADARRAAQHGELQFVAVGTPPAADGSADLTHVLETARSIGAAMTGYTVIVNKSTVPVGTADRVREVIAAGLAKRGEAIDFAVVSNPEFLKEGAAVADFMRPDRVVVGADDERAVALMRALCTLRAQPRPIAADGREERGVNQVRGQCDARNPHQLHERTVRPGREAGRRHRERARGHGPRPAHRHALSVRRLRLRRLVLPERCVSPREHGSIGGRAAHPAGGGRGEHRARAGAGRQDRRALRQQPGRPPLCTGRLAFKPGTDDMRDAPSRVLIERLTALGAEVVAYDPVVMTEAKRALGANPKLSFADSADAALRGASALVSVTE